MKKQEFDEGLQRHLWRCELQYRMENLPHGSCVDWLAPHCDNVQEIARFLRDLGFRLKETVSETDCEGVKYGWVTTTSGLVVYENTEGLVAMAAEMQNNREKKAGAKAAGRGTKTRGPMWKEGPK